MRAGPDADLPLIAQLPPVLRQFVTYFGVGLVAAVGHLGTGLMTVGMVGDVPASLAGFIVGGIIAYLLNRRFTFQSDRRHEEAVPRFLLVSGIGFLITWLMMTLLTGFLSLSYLPAQVVTILIVLAWNFTANRLWTFRPAAG